MKPTQYKAKLDFGKVDAEGKGKVNRVVVEIELRGDAPKSHLPLSTTKGLELSICGQVHNARGSDWLSGGQNYDELAELLPHSPLMSEIVGVWKRWHLNDMNAGDSVQEDYLRENGRGKSYEETREILDKAGLLTHDGYEYGTAWKSEELPAHIIKQVMGWEKHPELTK